MAANCLYWEASTLNHLPTEEFWIVRFKRVYQRNGRRIQCLYSCTIISKRRPMQSESQSFSIDICLGMFCTWLIFDPEFFIKSIPRRKKIMTKSQKQAVELRHFCTMVEECSSSAVLAFSRKVQTGLRRNVIKCRGIERNNSEEIFLSLHRGYLSCIMMQECRTWSFAPCLMSFFQTDSDSDTQNFRVWLRLKQGVFVSQGKCH